MKLYLSIIYCNPSTYNLNEILAIDKTKICMDSAAGVANGGIWGECTVQPSKNHVPIMIKSIMDHGLHPSYIGL